MLFFFLFLYFALSLISSPFLSVAQAPQMHTHTFTPLPSIYLLFWRKQLRIYIAREIKCFCQHSSQRNKQCLPTKTTTGVHQLCLVHPNEWDSALCSFRLPGSWVDTGSGSSTKFLLGLGEKPQPVPARGWSWQGTQARKPGCGVTLGCWLVTLCCH